MKEVQPLTAEYNRPATVAVLEHLSGPSIGSETYLYSDEISVGLSPDRHLTIRRSKHTQTAETSAVAIASLARSGHTYSLKAENGKSIWINGRRVQSAELIDSDIIEFGEKGPLSRFRLLDTSQHSRRYFSEICSDCWDYLRSSRKPLVTRVFKAKVDFFKRLLSDTSGVFRIAMITGLSLLAFVTFQQYKLNLIQEIQLQGSAEKIDSFAQALSLSQQNSLSPADLDQLREDLALGLNDNASRLTSLERKSAAAQDVIRASGSSVVFLQGGYGFRDRESGKMLRHALGADGKPITGPGERPLLSLDGDGQPAERNYTGTAFAIADGSILVTNRHVAVPWKNKIRASSTDPSGLEPVMIKFIAYSPGHAEAWPVEVLEVSADADLALLRVSSGGPKLAPLKIAHMQPSNGELVIVMGYPTGLRSIVARAGGEFISHIQEGGTVSFWDVAAELAGRKLIEPLASMGIVAQLTSQFIVYDAATTSGGSGGPVLNTQGEVVAVNAAILPEYGGSNLGVPAAKLIELMKAAGY